MYVVLCAALIDHSGSYAGSGLMPPAGLKGKAAN
jgi:hypothetical protein